MSVILSEFSFSAHYDGESVKREFFSGNIAVTNANPTATSTIARKRWKLLSSALVKPATSSRVDQNHENNEEPGAATETAIRFPNYGLMEITEEDGDEQDLQWCRVQSRDERFKFNFKVISKICPEVFLATP